MESAFKNGEFAINSSVGQIIELFIHEYFHRKLKHQSINILRIIPMNSQTRRSAGQK
jgi:hypothetical protein